MLGCVIAALVVRLFIAHAAIGLRLGGFSTLGVFLVGLPLSLN
jgi:hypothetical protein